MKKALEIFRFIAELQARGEQVVLVTLVNVEGSAVRALGTHMAVASNGEVRGTFSGGCIEAAVVAEALAVLEQGAPRQVRFGAGSPYIDVRLPCGGGVDLLFDPLPDAQAVQLATRHLEARRSIVVRLSLDQPLHIALAGPDDHTHREGGELVLRHDPMLRIVIAGHGAEPGALMRAANAYGASLLLLSPDAMSRQEAVYLGVPEIDLVRQGPCTRLTIDSWTAVVMLFHDHEWEIELLLQALASPAFFIGAMGSQHTHAERCASLSARGIDPLALQRIVGPIGLIKASRDPETLAVSIMAQLVQAYERRLTAPSMNPVQRGIEYVARG